MAFTLNHYTVNKKYIKEIRPNDRERKSSSLCRKVCEERSFLRESFSPQKISRIAMQYFFFTFPSLKLHLTYLFRSSFVTVMHVSSKKSVSDKTVNRRRLLCISFIASKINVGIRHLYSRLSDSIKCYLFVYIQLLFFQQVPFQNLLTVLTRLKIHF